MLPTVSPGLFSSAIVSAHARPNTTKSKSELAPRRLAPCTDEEADSPQAYRPGTILSSPLQVIKACKNISCCKKSIVSK